MVYRGKKINFIPESLRAINFIKFNVSLLNVKFYRGEMFVEKADSWFEEKYI